MPACAVACCSNHNRANTTISDVTFHRFPKDKVLRKCWVNACRRKDQFNADTARVCSKHFSNDDFRRDFKSELMNQKERRCLIKTAVPSLHIPGVKQPDSLEERHRRLEVRKRKKCISDLIHNDCKKMKNTEYLNEDDIISVESKSCTTCNVVPEILQNLEEKEKEIEQLKAEITLLNTKVANLKKNCIYWQNKTKILYAECRKNKKQNRKLLKADCGKHVKAGTVNSVDMNIRSMLKGVFSESQIRAIVTRKRVKWCSSDIVTAITLRGLSKRAYNFMRTKMHIPLPGITTIKRWLTDIKFSPGLLHEVLHMMKEKASTMANFEKLCVILFDEMAVDAKIGYDHSEDTIYGPHKLVQVVMVRGLVSSWKQPIYYEFDCRLTKYFLFSIINSIEKTGFQVVAMVCDLGGGNQALWKEIGITTEKTFFQNPHDNSRNVFAFADVPHLLKLLRNHTMDSGLRIPSGQILNKDMFLNVLQKDNGELKLCPKLTINHIFVNGPLRMKVSLAAQIFSHHVSSAIMHFMPLEKECADFVELVNNTFDILNSRCPNNSIHFKQAYGEAEKTQKEELLKMREAILQLRVVGKTNALPFQRGFAVTITSLISLHEYLKNLGMRYILTSRLNQDCLENLFSQVRGMGRGYDHPLPNEFKHRLRLLVLSGQTVDPSPVSNVQGTDTCYLTKLMLKGLDSNKCCIDQEFKENQEFTDMEIPEMQILRDDALQISSLQETEKEALEYITGYIAFRIKDPQLICKSKEDNLTWIDIVNRGGLTKPSQEFVQNVNSFEKIFQNMHGKSLKKCKGLISNFQLELKQNFPYINEKILHLFSRLRTFIRIKYLNRCQVEKAKQKIRKKNIQWAKSSISK